MTGVFVDDRDHVWVTHLPETLTPDGWQGNFTGSDIATRFPSFDAYLAERA